MNINDEIILNTPCPQCNKKALRIIYGLNHKNTERVICNNCKSVFSSKNEYLEFLFVSTRNRKPVSQKQLVHNVMSKSKTSNTIVRCPYCNSTNTNKISTLSKVGNAAVFGVFAIGKLSKQWHCNNCNSDF